ncbi:MAG: radical SAM family heme chaperone HemW [Mariprofundaceae bacterium]|nr:radical SAM family heme chaperone HemW [Mariprofundaceae bacterium]
MSPPSTPALRRDALHLYVHIPFCIHKCAYCDFNSHVRDEPAWDAYRSALLRELECRAHQEAFTGRRIDTIFFGGGTPSLAPAELIGEVLDDTQRLFTLTDNAEITLEANPGTIEAGRFSAYRQAGVNRLSIGVQSFKDAELQWLERIHNAEQAREAYATARSAGFDNISLDLMYGLPGQSMSDWLENLQMAIDLSPEHLSCYQLTIEAHTELARRHKRSPLALPQDDDALHLLHNTRKLLLENAYHAYEISNFSRPGYACRHNDAYWLYHDYIGIGAGAAGKWDTAHGGITRYSNVRSPEGYIRAVNTHGKAVNSDEQLVLNKAAGEAVWLGLRRSEGLNREGFRLRFRRDVIDLFGSALKPWQQSGHLITTERAIRLSDQGLGLADSIAVSVFSAD